MNATMQEGSEFAGAAGLRHAMGTTRKTSSPELKQAVCAFVDEARTFGWPIERMIVQMKTMAREGGAEDTRRPGEPDGRFTRVIEQAISWAIAYYYGEPLR